MSLDSFLDATLVVLGHGTSLNENSAGPVRQHVGELARRNLFAAVREGFWKQEPQLNPVLAAVTTPRVFIVPLMISEGYFSSEVIPRELGFELTADDGSRIRRVTGRTILYCRPVGTHPSMTKVLLARAREVVEQHPFPRAPRPREISLFLAGHGTERNPQSKTVIEQQVALIRAQNEYAEVQAVYMDEDPRIEGCQAHAQARNVVVVPFFMSDGLHTTEDIPVLLGEAERVVKQRLASGQPSWRNPTEINGKLTWYATAVGSAPELAEVILARVRELAQIT